MSYWFKRHLPEIFVFFGGLIIVLGVFLTLLHYNGDEFMIRSDSPLYLQLAENMINYKIFSISADLPLNPSSFRVPLYPAFLSIIFVLINNIYIVGIFQCFLAALGILYVFKIGKILNEKKIGLAAAFLFGIDFFHIVSIGTIGAEALFIPLFIAGIYYFLFFFKTLRNSSLVAASLLLGCAMLTKPVITYLWIGILAIMVFIFYKKRSSLFILKTILLSGIMLSIVVVPWMVRNKYVFNDMSISSSKNYNLYFWYLGSIHSQRLGVSESEARLILAQKLKKEFPDISAEELKNLPFSNYFRDKSSQVLEGREFQYLKKHILGSGYFFVSNYYRKAAYMAIGASEEEIPVYNIAQLIDEGTLRGKAGSLIREGGFPVIMMLFGFLISGFYLFFFILNIFFLRRVSEPKYEIFLYCIVGYFALITGPLASGSYRHPVLPFIIILALLGLKRCVNTALPFLKKQYSVIIK